MGNLDGEPYRRETRGRRGLTGDDNGSGAHGGGETATARRRLGFVAGQRGSGEGGGSEGTVQVENENKRCGNAYIGGGRVGLEWDRW